MLLTAPGLPRRTWPFENFSSLPLTKQRMSCSALVAARAPAPPTPQGAMCASVQGQACVRAHAIVVAAAHGQPPQPSPPAACTVSSCAAFLHGRMRPLQVAATPGRGCMRTWPRGERNSNGGSAVQSQRARARRHGFIRSMFGYASMVHWSSACLKGGQRAYRLGGASWRGVEARVTCNCHPDCTASGAGSWRRGCTGRGQSLARGLCVAWSACKNGVRCTCRGPSNKRTTVQATTLRPCLRHGSHDGG